jgi:alkylglycerol monooxygenase
MHLNLLAMAVPFFVGLMLLEYYFSKKRGGGHFHLEEAIANLNVGIAERLSDIFTTGLFYFFFVWLHDHLALFSIKPNAVTWVLLFLFTDLMWYWYHRFGHVVNLFWSVHVVHHQSDDFNFTVSARITVLQATARCLFWAVLPIIGFPAEMITVLLLIHGTYPFFTHTQLVGKLGWLEYIFVTPSHHRVHHSSNEAYLDKNYGDVLIIWDKLFGTFAKETETPVYGLTKPLNSHSFLWQHFHFILEIMVAFRRTRGWRNKWLTVFGRPDLIDPRIRTSLERKFSKRNNAIRATQKLQQYIKGQTVLNLFLLFLVILFEHYLPASQMAVAALFILLSVITVGAMLEQRTWIVYLEYARLYLAGVYIHLLFPSPSLAIVMLLVYGVLLLYYKSVSNRYCNYLYEYD